MIMVALITDGVKVSVETGYQADYSNPMENEYVYAYRVTIENLSANPMTLIEMYLGIFDSKRPYRELESKGVEGVHPVIASNEAYSYVSGYTFHSDMGYIKGQYIFEDLRTSRIHYIMVPSFDLVAPFKYN